MSNLVFQQTITDRVDTESSEFNQIENYSFPNPFKKTIFINALEFALDPAFSLKGEILAYVGDDIIFDSKKVSLKNFSVFSVPLSNSEFEHQKQIRIFVKNNEDSQKIGFDVTIKISEISENLSRPNMPLNRTELAQVYSQSITPFEFKVYSNEIIDKSLYLEGYNKMIILISASQIKNPIPIDYLYPLDPFPSITSLLLQLQSSENTTNEIIHDPPRRVTAIKRNYNARVYSNKVTGGSIIQDLQASYNTSVTLLSENSDTEITELGNVFVGDTLVSSFVPVTYVEEIKSYDYHQIGNYDSEFDILLDYATNNLETRFNWIHSISKITKKFKITAKGSWRTKRNVTSRPNGISYSVYAPLPTVDLGTKTLDFETVTVGSMLLNLMYSYELIIESADDIEFTQNVRALETFVYEKPIKKRYTMNGRFIRIKKRTTVRFANPVVSFNTYETKGYAFGRSGGGVSRLRVSSKNFTVPYYSIDFGEVNRLLDDIDFEKEKSIDVSTFQNNLDVDNFFDYNSQGGTSKISFGILGSSDEYEELISAESIGTITVGQKKLIIISDESSDQIAIARLLLQNPNLIIRLTVEKSVQTGIRIYLVK